MSTVRILYICRIFSGLEQSLNGDRWQPTGAPTIYKIIEGLDASEHEVRFVMTGKGVGSDYCSGWKEQYNFDLELEGLRHPIRVLSSEYRFPAWLGRARGYLNLLRQSWTLWREAKRFKPDLVYVDRSNLIPGAFIARYSKIPVLLRVMGVYPSMWDIFHSRHPLESMQRWAYRSPFRYVICTQDGTGGEEWMERALHPEVPRQMMLNGVNYAQIEAADAPPDILRDLPKDRMTVLFVGRLEGIKGCSEFVDALLRLHPEHAERIHALVVGIGSLGEELRQRVREQGAEAMFTFVERLPHEQIARLHKGADIYVSLNKLGNLSNANLEAMAAGACMIFPEARPEKGVDVATNTLVPADAAVRIGNDDQVEALAEAVLRLLPAPGERERLGKSIAEVAREFIPDWQRRVEEELQLLEEISATEREG